MLRTRLLVLASLTACLWLASSEVFRSRAVPPPPPATWKVVAWNDLGMHCMDSDYGVFSILPPFNVLHAQVIDNTGQLVQTGSGVNLTYEATPDPAGSINTTSIGKTNFWTYANTIYGASTTPDVGLFGFTMPGPLNNPQALPFQAGGDQWVATGIPITPYDDQGRKRAYPMVKVKVVGPTGSTLATTSTVLPVSDEMDCRVCHGSGSDAAAQPTAGWVNDPNSERDYRLNILRLHDQLQSGSPTYTAALATAGLSSAGLYASVVQNNHPVLCASCHGSNALPGTGQAGISPLTSAMHAGHATVVDPTNSQTLDASTNRSACYRCHPGSETRCLRGAMGSAVAADGSLSMQCQSCHGSMSAVGAPTRVGWLQQPSCQNCHSGTALVNSGQIRYTDAHTANGQLRTPADATFATNANTPATGFDLFRFSTGHGGLQCEACHGSTHAEYPALHQNDNVESQNFQGHVGVLVECEKCHNSQPTTIDGGPHGMHPLGQSWVSDDHGDFANNGNAGQCRACHGTDYKGTVLSKSHADRSYSTPWGTKTFPRGSVVGCYSCHKGPTDDDGNNGNANPVVQNVSATTTDQPVVMTLTATDANASQSLTLRIVKQPDFGTVALSGTTATYYPEPGFAGTDTFTFAARDGQKDSNIGTATINRGATSMNYGFGYPGTGGVVPVLTLSAPPAIGHMTTLDIQNTSNVGAFAALFASYETANAPTGYGGALLVLPIGPYVPLTLPPQGLSMPFMIPNDPSLVGVAIDVQVVQFDPGASFLFAFSRGLKISFGL